MGGRGRGEETRARVLEAASSLMLSKGFASMSIGDIVRATGVKKGNLYFHFSSKEELGLTVLEEERERFFLFLCQNLKGERPFEKVRNLLEATFYEHRQRNFAGGCLFGNMALEMSDRNPRFCEMVKEVFLEWTARLANVLAEAMAAGELSQAISPTVLAKHIVALIEGAIMMAKVSKDEKDLKDCLESLRILLGM
ncbi:MAG: TetR/AcrR family transcriptional regulator [Deltaproteobacteria bacterium]|nr:TetR/AcrR family transcriptional regulator [Deltaproteobacteria bacterium]